MGLSGIFLRPRFAVKLELHFKSKGLLRAYNTSLCINAHIARPMKEWVMGIPTREVQTDIARTARRSMMERLLEIPMEEIQAHVIKVISFTTFMNLAYMPPTPLIRHDISYVY